MALAELNFMNGGSGGGIDLMNPDYVEQAVLSSGQTKTVNVSSKPKYVIATMHHNSYTQIFGTIIIDIENQTAKMYGYDSELILGSDFSYNDTVSNVTDSSITFKRFGSDGTIQYIYSIWV